MERIINTFRKHSRSREPDSTPDRPAAQAVPVTAEQLRAARAMLNLSRRDFAVRLQLSLDELRGLENQSGPLQGDASQLRHVSGALLRLGVELVPAGVYVGAGGPGVRLKRRAKRAPMQKVPVANAEAERRKQPETEFGEPLQVA